MLNWFDYLNKTQNEAAKSDNTIVHGPSGSGKTVTLLFRLVYLIEELGVEPEKILVLLPDIFGVKLLKEELELYIGEKLSLLTIDSIGHYSYELMKQKNNKFSITTLEYILENIESIGKPFIKESELTKIRKFYYSPENDPDNDLDEKVSLLESFMKERCLETPESIITKILNKQIDISDMISDFEYVLFDRIEQISVAEYEFFKLISFKKNIWITKSSGYCIPEKEFIELYKGKSILSSINGREQVKCSDGFGNVCNSIIKNVEKRAYDGIVVNIKTSNGKSISATPNHIMFARHDKASSGYQVSIVENSEGAWLSILEDDFSKKTKKDKISPPARIWVLKTYKDYSKAVSFLSFLSCRYSVPLFGFSSIVKSEEAIRLNKKLNAKKGSHSLKRDFFISEDYPHFIVDNGKDKNLKIVYFGGDKCAKKHSHLLRVYADKEQLRGKFPGFKNESWFVQTEKDDFEEVIEFSRSMNSVENIMVSQYIQATDKDIFQFFPASHIQPGMFIPVLKGNSIKEDRVESVEWEDYKGKTVDVNVPECKNFIVNDVLIHNSSPFKFGKGIDIDKCLEKDFSDLHIIKFDKNYRTSSEIVDIINDLGKTNQTSKVDKDENAEKIIEVFKCRDEHDEVINIIDRIQSIIFKHGKSYADFAVFYRLPKQAEVFKEQFFKRSIPFRVISDENFFRLKEIGDVLAYLHASINNSDDSSIKRIINVPRRGIGNRTIELVNEYQKAHNIGFFDALGKIVDETDFPQRFVKQVRSFKELIDDFNEKHHEMDIKEFFEYLLDKSMVISEFSKMNTNKALDCIANIKSFPEKIANEISDLNINSIRDCLAYIAYRHPFEDFREENTITLADFNLAGYLEFPVVFMCGVEKGLTPYAKNNNAAEEASLFIRALSRCSEKVFFSFAEHRRLSNEKCFGSPSEYIIKCKLLDDNVSIQTAEMREKKIRKEKRKLKKTLKSKVLSVGNRVAHRMWGQGTILALEGTGEGLTAVVEFDNVGEKKLILKYAPLQKLAE